jgi:hypothetical protein
LSIYLDKFFYGSRLFTKTIPFFQFY